MAAAAICKLTSNANSSQPDRQRLGQRLGSRKKGGGWILKSRLSVTQLALCLLRFGVAFCGFFCILVSKQEPGKYIQFSGLLEAAELK
jgi:hypothetical protein